MTKVLVTRVGPVDVGWSSWAVGLLKELYGRVEEPPYLVYVVVVHDAPTFRSLVSSIHEEVGALSPPAYEEYEAVHDAYTGAPRIVLCEELIRRRPMRAQAGAILHEGAHSVLHGELRFYEVSLSLASRLGLGGLSLSALYLLSVAVKDYEATRLLVDVGFRGEAKDYALSLLSSTSDLGAEWRIAKLAGMEPIHLAELLKPLCCASPLMGDEEVVRAALGYVGHLPRSLAEGLVELAFNGRWRLNDSFEGRLEGLIEGFRGLTERGGLHRA